MKTGLVLMLTLTIGLVVGQSSECEQDTDCTDDHICQDTNCVKTGVFCNAKKHCNASLVGTACLDNGLCGCLNAGNCVEGAECSEEICVRIDGFCRTDEECEEADEKKLNPLLYRDDIANLSETVKATQEAIMKVETLLETKLLDFNLKKSAFLTTGSKKSRVKIQKEILNIDSLNN